MIFLLLISLALPLERDTVFTGDGTWGPYFLSPFILNGSLNITLNREVVPYSISEDRGILFFNHPISSSDTVRCEYLTVPFKLRERYFIREEITDTSHREERLLETPAVSSSIRFGGEKRFGISVGSRDGFSMDQSTQIAFEGRLSDNLRIEGELSDDNLPMRPGGTTHSLTDFEKSFIKATGKNYSLILGDLDFSFNPEGDPIERKLKGVRMDFNHKAYSGDMTVSIAKGLPRRVGFVGRSGKQGPYILSDKSVIPGSEEVYLDNRRLAREKEYEIDYPSGRLDFMPSLPILGGEEIVVYFEEGNTDYAREVYGANFSANKGVSLNIGVFREADNFALGEEERKIIASAEDSVVWLSASRYVGENNGDYVMIDSIFIYVGYRKGDWNVRFTKREAGSYEYNDLLGGFEYVGDGMGRFIPYIPVTVPKANTLSILSLEKEFGSSRVSISGLASLNERNILNRDRRRIGKAGNISYELKRDMYGLRASLWSESDGFHYPDRKEEWGRGYDLNARLDPIRWFSINGHIRQGSSPERGLNLRIGTEKRGLLYNENKRTELRERSLKFLFGFKNILPYVIVGDMKRESIRAKRYGVGLQKGKIAVEITDETRDTLSYHLWQPYERTKNLTLTSSIRDMKLDMTYRQGKRWGEDMSILLGTLSGSFNTKYATVDLAHHLSRRERTLHQEFYYEVQEGRGSFSRDSLTGRYYPDEHGNYERKYIPFGCPQLVNQFSFRHTINILPIEDYRLTISTLKSGEGDRISFWQRVPGVRDENLVRISLSAKDGFLITSYSRQDVRDGRTIGFTVQREREVIDVALNTRLFEMPLSVSCRREQSIESYIDGERLSDEILHEIQTGIDFPSFKNIESSITATLGEQRIADYLFSPSAPLSTTRFIRLSPSLFYHRENKKVNAKIEITDRRELDSKTSSAMRALYPVGMSYLFNLSLTLLPNGNTEYIIDYTGRKKGNHPLDNTIGIEARMSF